MKLPPLPDEPKISVVTVSFNPGQFIEENIESVLAQNYPHVEHIVIDAGSTDETLSILKKYNHLQWTSEPDRGQTHGLNKGFRKATGEIIGWLNSDDRYAPNIFPDVVQALQTQGVVLGACEFTDKQGNVTESVPNTPRNWFDIWKYWIYHSSPAQPSIFFRRDALEAVSLGEDYFLDETLHYAMDYELWLRMARRFPFHNQVKKTFAYFRMYDENKTGADGAATYREAARIYKRYNLRNSQAERLISVVIPIETISPEFERSLKSCVEHGFRSFEIVLVPTSRNPEQIKQIKEYIRTLCEKTKDGRYRVWTPHGEHHTQASYLLALSRIVNAPTILLLQPGDALQELALLTLSYQFSQDSLGALLTCGGNQSLFSGLTTEREGQPIFNLESIFMGQAIPQSLAFRTLALQEIEDEVLSLDNDTALRQLLALIQYKAWNLTPMQAGILSVTQQSPSTTVPLRDSSNEYLQATLIDSLASIIERDPFAAVRRENGFIIEFPSETVKTARSYLEMNTPGST